MEHLYCCMCERDQDCYETIRGLEDFVADTAPYAAAFFECSNCGHNFIFPALSGDELAKAYVGYYTQSGKAIDPGCFMGDQRFSNLKFYYDGLRKRGNLAGLLAFLVERIPLFGFMLRRAVRFVPLPIVHGNKLLDIGCGNGQFLVRAKDIGYAVVGLDFDEKTVEVARSLGLDVRHGEINSIDHSETYDVITLSHVIEHVHDPRSLLQAIHGHLSAGGFFYLATPNFGSAGRKTFGKFWRGLEFPRHLHMFNTNQLENLLKEIGFSRVEVVYDLPQSIGILKTSYKIFLRQNGGGLTNLVRLTARLLTQRPFAKNSLDVIAIRCWK